MYANLTQETCTGTGDTLTLTGADASNLPFSASFTDGDLVAYALEDSGGSIKVAGIGTYNAGTITRNDTWNYNGSVVDKAPTSNIALSAGEHVVRCDVTSSKVYDNTVTKSLFVRANGSSGVTPLGFAGASLLDKSAPLASDSVRGMFYMPPASFLADAVYFDVSVLSSVSTARFKVLLYVVRNGQYTTELLFESQEQDGSAATGSTGLKIISFGESFLFSESDIYGIFYWSNDGEIEVNGSSDFPAVKHHFSNGAFSSGETQYPTYAMPYSSPAITALQDIPISDRSPFHFRIPAGILRSAL